ncbi:hypothetical protein KKG24_01535 [Patescibacteria group bacterium]|nr:hypothetical protein [Patescibacteria group bacterium]
MKNEKRNTRKRLVNFFIVVNFLFIFFILMISPAWVISSWATKVAWVFLGIALGAFMELDKPFVQFLKTCWARRRQRRWSRQLREMASPEWRGSLKIKLQK